MTGITIQPPQLSTVLPFHVVFDRSMRILAAGSAWQRVCPAVTPGALMPDCFRFLRPELRLEPEVVQQNLDTIVVLESRERGLPFRGLLLRVEGSDTLFVGSPAAQGGADLSRFGLSLDDWPLYNAGGWNLLQADHQEIERTRSVIDNALDAVITIDQESRVTSWNTQAEATFGWSRGEAIGRPLHELIIPPHLKEAHAKGMARYLATGEARVLNRRVEVTGRHRDGREFPVELTITPIQEGGSLSFSAFVRDISVSKRQESLLNTQHEVTRLLASEATLPGAALQILRIVGQFLEWDVGALWLVDPPTRELRAIEVWHRLGPDLEAFVSVMRSAVFASGVGLPGRVLAAGNSMWIPRLSEDHNSPRGSVALQAGLTSAVALPVMVAGRAEGVIEFFSQSSREPDPEVLRTLEGLTRQVGQFVERELASRAVRQHEVRIRAVIDHMLEGLVVVGPDLRILEANQAFAHMFGYDEGHLTGLSILSLMPATPEYQERARLAEIYRQSLGHVTQREGRRKSGEVFPMELQVYEMTTPEGTLIAGHVRDLTSEQEADRMKKQFVASVSHELRTPLTAIRGSLGLLALGAAGELSAEGKNIVQMAERNAVRLMGIVDDILDFERIQEGRLTLERTEFALGLAIARSQESVAALAEPAGITIVATPTGATVLADEARVVQVIVNLLSNAIKFSPAGSQIDVAAEAHPEGVEVRVRDRGRGVPEALRTIIFEPFRQSEQSDARTRGGAGLGLAICRAIVRQHGGDIGVEGHADGGSTFWFTLPTPPL